ncbi:MAG: PG0541 family transporter-associated protein [Bacteroidales bacterium]
MYIIYCTCNISVQEQLLEIIEACHIREYQVTDQVKAKNKKADPRFNDPVWPGYNSSVLMQVKEADKVELLAKRVKEFNTNAFNPAELVTFCAWPMTHYFFD